MYSQQIKTFLCVAERGSLSKAAQDLYVTPASIMKQMNALEARLGLTLLRRTNQGVALTEAGTYIYRVAQKIVAQSEDAVRQARAIQQRGAKTIRIGSSFLNPGNVLIELWNRLSPDPGLRLCPMMTTIRRSCPLSPLWGKPWTSWWALLILSKC